MEFFILDSHAEGLPALCDAAEQSVSAEQSPAPAGTVVGRWVWLPPGDSQPPPPGNDQPFPRHHLPDQESWSLVVVVVF